MAHKPSGRIYIPVSGEGTIIYEWSQHGRTTHFVLDPSGSFGGPWRHEVSPTPKVVSLDAVKQAFDAILTSAAIQLVMTIEKREQMLRIIERQFGS